MVIERIGTPDIATVVTVIEIAVISYSEHGKVTKTAIRFKQKELCNSASKPNSNLQVSFVTAYRSDAQKMLLWNYAVAQFVEALRYQSESRGIDYRWRL